MLVLTRKKDQSIVIGEKGDQVRIGINAPKSIAVHRKEVFLEIREENLKAAEVGNVSLKDLLKHGAEPEDKKGD